MSYKPSASQIYFLVDYLGLGIFYFLTMIYDFTNHVFSKMVKAPLLKYF
jgi:hypothetical protein